MLKFHLAFALLFAQCLSAFLSASPVPLQIQVCLEHQEIFPHVMGNGDFEGNQTPGVVVELLRLSEQASDEVNFTYRRDPWITCVARLNKNYSQATIAVTGNPFGKNLIFPGGNKGSAQEDIQFIASDYCMFYRKNDELVWSEGKLIGELKKPVVVPRGYAVSDILHKSGIEPIEVSSSQLAMTQLANNKADAAVASCIGGRSYLSNWQLSRHFSEEVIATFYGHLAFSAKFYQEHASVIDRLWERLDSISRHRYIELMNAYFSSTSPASLN